MTEFDPYEKHIHSLQNNLTLNSDIFQECNKLEENLEVIRNSLQLRMIADPLTVLLEQQDLKVMCCKLLLQVYDLKPGPYADTESGHAHRIRQLLLIITMTRTLEDLFFFCNEYGKLVMNE